MRPLLSVLKAVNVDQRAQHMQTGLQCKHSLIQLQHLHDRLCSCANCLMQDLEVFGASCCCTIHGFSLHT